LEGANASNSNVDKDGNQIIHEEHMIRDHEQNEGKLPSKLSRRLPTTQMIILWLDINMNH
jgi:hypothetical protein